MSLVKWGSTVLSLCNTVLTPFHMTCSKTASPLQRYVHWSALWRQCRFCQTWLPQLQMPVGGSNAITLQGWQIQGVAQGRTSSMVRLNLRSAVKSEMPSSSGRSPWLAMPDFSLTCNLNIVAFLGYSMCNIALASDPCTRVLRGQHTQNTGYFIKHGLRELQKSRAIFSQ